MATARIPDHRQQLRLDPAVKRRRAPAPPRRVSPLVLWLGVLGGPVAFGLVRTAALVLVAGSCQHATGSALALGLSSRSLLLAAITTVCALTAGLSALLSWHAWDRVRSHDENESLESSRTTQFWALGGIFLSSVFFVAIILTGGLALGLETTCVT